MSLTDEQVAQFKTEGYCVVENFYDDREVSAMQAEVDRLMAEGAIYNVRTENDGVTEATTKQNLQLCPMTPHSPLVKAMPFEPKVTDAVTRLIGDDIILHLDQTFVKPGLRGTGTNWHQDNAYFKIADPLQGTAMWVAVHDATIANGTMRIVPHMFQEPLEHTRDPESNHHIRCFPPEEKSIALEVPAGAVAFFCYGTPHCTMANNTLKTRAGIALHFLTYEAAIDDPERGNLGSFSDDRDYRPYLTGPKATHGVNEYGEDMRGKWLHEVDKLLAVTA